MYGGWLMKSEERRNREAGSGVCTEQCLHFYTCLHSGVVANIAHVLMRKIVGCSKLRLVAVDPEYFTRL